MKKIKYFLFGLFGILGAECIWASGIGGSVSSFGPLEVLENKECQTQVATNLLIGDVNNDKTVDVSDITGIVNLILGSSDVGLNRKAADVNRDGTIDVTDITAVVNIILTGGENPDNGDAGGTGSDMPWG